jgi:hypothetical protein
VPLWKEIYLLACDAVVDTSLGCSGKATPVRSGRFLVWLLVMVSMVALTVLLLRLVFTQWPLLLLLFTLANLLIGLPPRLGAGGVVSVSLNLGA